MAAASSASAISPMWPGTVLTPAACASFLEVILSPICSIAPDGGPMKTTPSASNASANFRFSDRKPYPGWTASAPVWRIASMILSITMYDWLAGAGPIWTASSAIRTCSALRSASE